MKASVYKELQEALRQQNDNVLETVRRSYPWIEFDTLVAIYSQECSRHVRLQHHKFRTRQRIQEYITRYISGEDVMEISKSFELPPCTLARFLLEHMVGLQKNQVSTCLKDPLTYLPPSPIMVEVPSEASKDNSPLVEVSRDRLCTDVYRCIDNDLVSSPCVAVIRRVTGLEYEVLLGEKLQDLGIAFQSEDALRTAGFSKPLM